MNLRRSLVSGRYLACVIPTLSVLITLLAGPMFARDLALQISNETAPPNGWAQIKISSATQQLVAGGHIVMKFDPSVFGDILGVAVFSAEGDATGLATVIGQSLDVSFHSAAGGIGQLPHLPILTVTIAILATAPVGNVSAITLDASLTDAQNNAYSVSVAAGSVTVGGSLSIRNLVPGGGLLPAGALVRINGIGFGPLTTVSIDEVSVSKVQFLTTGEIDLTLGGPADLTGKRVVLSNSDGSRAFRASPTTGRLRILRAAIAILRPTSRCSRGRPGHLRR